MSATIPVGISACLDGKTVGTKGVNEGRDVIRMSAPFIRFESVCLEIPPDRDTFISVPGTARMCDGLSEQCSGERQKSFSGSQMPMFFQSKTAQLSHLCGLIVCGESCDDSLVQRPVLESASKRKISASILTAGVLRVMPWLPVEEEGRLCDPELRENFIERVCTLHEFNQFRQSGATHAGLIAFHTKYKLLLLAHSQPLYRELGRFVAGADNGDSLQACLVQYRLQLMSLLTVPATRCNHTNVLMHVQGYFRRQLSGQQRQELSSLIDDYRCGFQPLRVPVSLLKHYMAEYPNAWLSQQRYFHPYPEALDLHSGH